MEGDKISNLAKLLRKSGEIILQGEETLFLNDSLLKHINDSFTFLTEEDGDTVFQVTHSNNSDVELFRDVQFLHDFLQKVLKVCIVKDSSSHVPLKINKFKSLRVLELKKVPVKNVYGIQRLRSQLNSVKCVCCLQQLKQLLIMCGADKSSAHIWEGLTEGVFTHNGIDSIDNSFDYTPWLQKIDLSYNNFKSFSATFSLPNLKYLNLSHNLLESVPVVSREASNKLETLIAKNNYIKDISALSNYENLIELDLSCNSLTDHSALVPLHSLCSLKTLNLIGNPLSFHKKHRLNTVYHLHSNTVKYVFCLDLKNLSWRERRRIPKGHVIDLLSTNSINTDGNASSVQNPSGRTTTTAADFVSVQASNEFPSKDQNVAPRSSRQKKVKEAVIAEYSKEDEKENTDIVSGPSNDDHLKVKRRVEELREQFGQENWLVERAACHLQAALSLPRNSPSSLAQLISQSAGQLSHASSSPKEPVVLDNSVASVTPVEDRVRDEGPAIDAPLDGEDDACDDAHSMESEEPIEEKQEEAGNSLEELQELEEGRVFAARLLSTEKMETREVLLCACDRSLQERDVRTGGVRVRWALPGPLRSCELLPVSSLGASIVVPSPGEVLPSSDVALRLSFDTLRLDARSRTYFMDVPDAQALVRFLDNILASRSLADMNQVPYKCMKCSTQFCREENFMYSTKGSIVLCPNCNSQIVCVMSESELPQPSIMESETIEKSAVTPIHRTSESNKSSPQYSIGSGASLEGEGDSAAGVAVSSTSLGSGTTSTTTTAAVSDTSGRGRGDSDVEVLSSTSSIEVLIEGETRTTPSRDSCNPDVVESRVQSDVNKTTMPISLTESSSSGSLTESICTTYETTNSAGDGSGSDVIDGLSAQHNNDKNWPSQELLEKAMEEAPLYRFEPIPSIQEMFEGLLESVDKKLSTKDNDVTVDGDNDFIQYSYTDFSHADHRLHLYFLQELFQAEDEKLLLVLRAEVLNMGLNKTFPSLLVVSSQYVWLLRVIGAERDTVADWLCSQVQWPLHALSCAFALPWAQGVGIGLREVQTISSTKAGTEIHHVLFFLQDPTRADAFLRAAEAVLPKSCNILFEAENNHAQQLRKLEVSSYIPSEDGSPIQFLGVFSSFSISDKKDYAVSYGIITVRMRDILITDSNLMWFYPIELGDEDIKVITAQKICNLLEVETNKSSLSLNFVDETNQSQEIWHLSFETPVCVKSLVDAIQSPWEDIFSVSLQVRDVSR